MRFMRWPEAFVGVSAKESLNKLNLSPVLVVFEKKYMNSYRDGNCKEVVSKAIGEVFIQPSDPPEVHISLQVFRR